MSIVYKKKDQGRLFYTGIGVPNSGVTGTNGDEYIDISMDNSGNTMTDEIGGTLIENTNLI